MWENKGANKNKQTTQTQTKTTKKVVQKPNNKQSIQTLHRTTTTATQKPPGVLKLCGLGAWNNNILSKEVNIFVGEIRGLKIDSEKQKFRAVQRWPHRKRMKASKSRSISETLRNDEAFVGFLLFTGKIPSFI